MGSLSSKTVNTWNTNGTLQEKDDYDYGASAITKKTLYTYQSFAATPIFPQEVSIIDLPSSVQVENGSGTVIGETNYSYDANTVASASAVEHDETNYPSSVEGPRGNPTTVTRECLGCTSATSTYNYDETGQIISMTDPCGNSTCSDMSGMAHTTTYSYADSPDSGNSAGQSNAYLTEITQPTTNSVAHVSSYAYNYATAELASSTDENSQTTNYTYDDSLNRLTEAQGPPDPNNSNQRPTTTYSYNDSAPTPSITTSELLNTSGVQKTSESIMDGMGHVTYTELTSDPGGTDIVHTAYDGFGNVASVTNPYRSTSDTTYGTTSYGYDALNRKTLQTQPDGSTLHCCYNNMPAGQGVCTANASSKTTDAWVDYSDETGRHWQQVSNSFGNLVAVVEENPSGALTMETGYQYDLLNNLTEVDQWGGVKGSSGDRKRLFTYDSLSQLLTAKNPETLTMTYTYDANGNVTSKTDARSISVGYQYDVLNRLTSKTASDSSFSYSYTYDQSGHGSGIGRLTNSSNNAGAGANYSYDSMGRITSAYQCVPGNCTYDLGASASYDLAGDMTNSHLADGTQVGMAYDAAGHLNGVTIPSSDPVKTLWSSPTYGPIGLTEATLGNGLREEYDYDNRSRITSYAVGQTDSQENSSDTFYGTIGTALNSESGGSSIPQGGFLTAKGWAADIVDGSPVARVAIVIDGSSDPIGEATLGGSRPDVVAATNQPTFIDSGWTFTGTIGDLPVGSHTVHAIAYDWSGNTKQLNTSSTPINVTSDTPPIGAIDSWSGVVTATSTVPQGGLITAQGWAADNEDGAPVARVVVMVDGLSIGDAILGGSRPDIAAAYNRTDYTNSGWTFTGSIGSVSPGTHILSVAVYDSSGNQTIAGFTSPSYNSTITVASTSDDLYGVVGTSVNASDSTDIIPLGGTLSVQGWAVEISQNPGAPLSRIEIDLDGQSLGVATLGISRSDVATHYNRPDLTNSGFTFTGPIGNVDPGEHTITARIFGHDGASILTQSSKGIIVTGTSYALPSGTPLPTRYSYELNYAANGNITYAADSVNGNWSYGYDNLNRLVSASSDTTGLAWTYDAFGNRWQQIATAGSAPQPEQSYNTATNRTDGFCYDLAGNMLDDGPCASVHRFSYDADEKLVSAEYGAITYLYDAEGRRIAKQSSGTTTNVYIYDVAGNAAVETDGSLNPLRTEIYAGSRHLATYAGGNYYYSHASWLGTEAARSDSSGNLCETVSSLPFGDAQQTTGSCSPTPLFFTGKERDTESGLDYFGARYYSSSMGRWMSPDWAKKPEAVPYSKLDNPQTLNLYGYVNNNPLSMADPDGHCCWDEAKQWMSDHPRTMQAAKGVGQVAVGVVGVGLSGTAEVGSGGTATVGVIFAVQGSVATGVMGVTNIVGAATKTDVSAAEKPLAAVSNPAGQIVTAATGSVDKGAQAAAIGDAVVTGANIKDLGEGSNAARAIKTVQAAQSAKEGVQAVREIQHPIVEKKKPE
jgi:RHS repeat-associated protein